MDITHSIVVTMLALAASGTAFAVSDPQSVSIYDRKPECMDRHSRLPPQACVIQNGPPPARHFIRRRSDQSSVNAEPNVPSEREVTAVPRSQNSGEATHNAER